MRMSYVGGLVALVAIGCLAIGQRWASGHATPLSDAEMRAVEGGVNDLECKHTGGDCVGNVGLNGCFVISPTGACGSLGFCGGWCPNKLADDCLPKTGASCAWKERPDEFLVYKCGYQCFPPWGCLCSCRKAPPGTVGIWVLQCI